MRPLTNEPLQVSDWVTGTSVNDEWIRGYVESAPAGGPLRVKVVDSDNPAAVDRTVDCRVDRIHRMPDEPLAWERDALLAMIDLALAAGDKVWFTDLHARLNDTVDQPQVELSFPANRIRNRLSHQG